jgi:hypothetical protein
MLSMIVRLIVSAFAPSSALS